MPKQTEPQKQKWTVNGANIEEVVHGTIFNALTVATEILLIESEWPHKGNVVSSVALTHSDGSRFTLSIQTPDKPKQ